MTLTNRPRRWGRLPIYDSGTSIHMAEVTLDRIQGVMSRQNDSCVVSSNPKKTKWWWHGGKRLACWFVYVTRNAYISSGQSNINRHPSYGGASWHRGH